MPSLRVLLFAALLHAAHGFSAAVPAVRLAHERAVSVRPCVHGCALRAFNPLFPELEEPEDRPSPLEELVAKYGRVSARAGSLACAVSLLTGRSIMCKHAAVQSPFFVVPTSRKRPRSHVCAHMEPCAPLTAGAACPPVFFTLVLLSLQFLRRRWRCSHT